MFEPEGKIHQISKSTRRSLTEWYGNDHFVHDGRKEEHNECSYHLWYVVTDARKVQMSDQPVVDREIPQAPIGGHFRTIPPVLV